MIRKAALLASLTATLLSPAAVALHGTASAQAGTASAAPNTARQTAQLVVEEIGPDLPREPTTEIKVSGSLLNTGKEVLSNLYIRMNYSPQPFTQRAHMAAYLSGQEGYQPPRGWWRTTSSRSRRRARSRGSSPSPRRGWASRASASTR
nr:hypothetical protein GCM10020093_075630 [Planobispora longispora]